MTAAQQLEQRGYQKALQASYADVWQAAQQAAERKAKVKTARKMLDAGSPIEFVKMVTDLEEEDLSDIDDTDKG